MRRFAPLTSMIALMTALGAAPAKADPAVIDLMLSPGNKRAEAAIGFSVPAYSTDTSYSALSLSATKDSKDRSVGSIGLLQRFGFSGLVGGASLSYDWEDTELGNEFEQVTVGLDLLGNGWDLRANYYIPREEEQRIGPTFTRLTGSGGQLFRTVLQEREIAMTGFDVEAGAKLGRVGGLDLSLSGGYYRFEEDGAPDVEGFKARFEAAEDERWSVGVEVRNDDEFGTQVFGVFRLRLTPFGEAPKREGISSRLDNPVRRETGVRTLGPGKNDPAVVTATQAVSVTGSSAALNAAGAFRFIGALPTNFVTGTGATTNATLAEALTAAAPGDVLVVGANQTGNFTLAANQQLIGLNALTVGGAALAPGAARPVLTAATGNVVTLANGNTVTGLRIVAPATTTSHTANAAVFGSNVSGFNIFGNDFTGNIGTLATTGNSGASSVGVRLDNMAGVAGTRSETRHFVQQPTTSPLQYYGTYNSGLGSENAEIIHFLDTGRGVVGVASNDINGSVDVLRLGSGDLDGLPLLQRRDAIRTQIIAAQGATAGGSVTSSTVHPTEDYYIVAVQNTNPRALGTLEIRRLSTGETIQRLSTGIGPDSTGISPNGRWALIADEAEPLDVAGSLTLIDLTNALTGRATATRIALTDQTGNLYANPAGTNQRFTNIESPLFPDGVLTHDPNGLQPEYVTFSADSRFAFVTLQENNGVIIVDLANGVPAASSLRYVNLGFTTPRTGVDLVNSNSNPPAISFTGTLPALPREPDGIGTFTINNQLYFIITEEGDSTVPGINTNLRYRGGRGVAIYNATTGALVSDIGATIDRALFDQGNAAMAANPTIYGSLSDAARYYPDNRSRRGGGEPEVLTVFTEGGRTYAAVGVERGASIALVDVTNPAAPVLLPLGLLPRDVTRVVDNVALEANPEGMSSYRGTSGTRYVAAGLEFGGQIAVYRFVPPATN
jgi:hypothetical protein